MNDHPGMYITIYDQATHPSLSRNIHGSAFLFVLSVQVRSALGVFSMCCFLYSPPGTVYVLTVTVFSCRHSQCGCYSSYGVQYFPVLLVYKVWICCVPSGLDIPSIPSVLAVINLCY